MGRWYCPLCEEQFEDEDLVTVKDDRGYYGSQRVTQDETGCPYCANPVEETVKCENCGEWFGKEELINGFCKDCIEEILEKPEFLRAYAEDDPDDLVEHWKENGGLYG